MLLPLELLARSDDGEVLVSEGDLHGAKGAAEVPREHRRGRSCSCLPASFSSQDRRGRAHAHES